MPNLLLEIRCEDLPASVLPKILEQLSEITHAYFAQERIAFEDIKVYGTLRRIALHMKNVSSRQSDDVREIRGPVVSEAFFSNSIPTSATEGFAKDVGVEINNLRIKEYDSEEYIVALIKKESKNTIDILPELLPKIISEIKTHNDIRWGSGDFRFVRPLRSIVALFGNEVINFTLGDITSGNITRGNRFLAPYKAVITFADNYMDVMEENMIIVDQEKRRDIIHWQLNMFARRDGATVVDDHNNALHEMVNRVEYPTALLGSFNSEYLKLPQSLLYHIICNEQHHFLLIKDGEIIPKFISVRDGDLSYISVVREGYERVLNAKLADANFFYQQDCKRELQELIDGLNWLRFKDIGGNMRDKTDRHERLALKLSELLNKNLEEIEIIKRAALLSFVDLSTGMVLEHPSLRGIIGKEFLKNLGEPDEITTAIGEQYLPNYENGNLPLTEIGRILSICVKIDDLCLSLFDKHENYSRQIIIDDAVSALCRFIDASDLTLEMVLVLVEYTLLMLSEEDVKTRESIVLNIKEIFKKRCV